MSEQPTPHPEFDEFVQTIAALRAPDGCPWDREQTHDSIAQCTVEEAYETVAAIEEHDPDHLCEELGDVLLQVVLHAQIAQDEGAFTIDDVIRGVNAKIVRRHPHVFGAQAAYSAAGIDMPEASTPDDVRDIWAQVKAHERAQKEQHRVKKMKDAGLDPSMPRGLLEDVSREQPALMQAEELSKKTVAVGFEWDSVEDVWAKVDEEIAEFKAATPGTHEADLEFGDILFTLVNVARKQHIDAEAALRATCSKFRHRWEHMEAAAYEQDTRIEDTDAAWREAQWQEAKKYDER